MSLLPDVFLQQRVFFGTLGVCILGFGAPKPWNMALNKVITWDPKLRVKDIKVTNLMSSITTGACLADERLRCAMYGPVAH